MNMHNADYLPADWFILLLWKWTLTGSNSYMFPYFESLSLPVSLNGTCKDGAYHTEEGQSQTHNLIFLRSNYRESFPIKLE